MTDLPEVHVPVVHPGVILREEFLLPKKMTVQDLYELVGLNVNLANDIIEGRAPISLSTAVLLSVAFGTSKDVWLALQSKYDAACAEMDNHFDPLKQAMVDITKSRGLSKENIENLTTNYVIRQGRYAAGEIKSQVANLMKRFEDASVTFETFSIFLKILWVKYEIVVTLTEHDGRVGYYSVRKP